MELGKLLKGLSTIPILDIVMTLKQLNMILKVQKNY